MNSRIHRSARRAALALAALAVAASASAWDKSSGPPPATKPAATAPSVAKATAAKPAPQIKRVDINNASSAELQTLPGIGEAEAQRIIAARPYPSKAKLVADQVLTFEAFAAIKDRIVAVQKLAPKAQAAAKPAGKS